MSADRFIDYVASRPRPPRRMDDLRAENDRLRERGLRIAAEYQHLSEETFLAEAECARLRRRLLDATPHGHSTRLGVEATGAAVPGCPRCALGREFADEGVADAG